MNLGEFHALVGDVLAQGSSNSSIVPSFVRQAARWLERNYTFEYMQRFFTFEIDPTEQTPRKIELEGVGIKKIEFVRTISSVGEYKMLTGIRAQDMDRLEVGPPTAYWKDGPNTLILNTTPDTKMSGELSARCYSAWPTVSAATHWLIDNAEDILLAQTCILYAPKRRDERFLAMWKSNRDEGIRTLNVAVDEAEYGGETFVMGYVHHG